MIASHRLAILDFGLQKYDFLKQQRVSHEDIRNEFKNSEGAPHMKGHRKSVAQVYRVLRQLDNDLNQQEIIELD